jgi:hypothetical protein
VTGRRMFAEDCCELQLSDATGTGAAVIWPSVKQLQSSINGAAVDVLVQIDGDGRLSIVDARVAE